MFLKQLILLVVIASFGSSSPAFAQFYGDPFTSGCPGCCKVQPKPPVCIETGLMPQCNYDVANPTPICVPDALKVLDLNELLKLNGEMIDAARANFYLFNPHIIQARREYDDSRSKREAIVSAIRAGVAMLPSTECLTSQTFYGRPPIGNPGAPAVGMPPMMNLACPKVCGDQNGGIKTIDYTKYAKSAAGALNGCLGAAIAIYDCYHEPTLGKKINMSVDAVAALIKVNPELKADCKSVGYACDGNAVDCLITHSKTICKEAATDLAANVKWLQPKTLTTAIACAKFDPISVGIDLAVVAGRLVYDLNACEPPKIWMSSADWVGKAQDAVSQIDSVMSEQQNKINSLMADQRAWYEAWQRRIDDRIPILNELLLANVDLKECVKKEKAKANMPVEMSYSRCGVVGLPGFNPYPIGNQPGVPASPAPPAPPKNP